MRREPVIAELTGKLLVLDAIVIIGGTGITGPRILDEERNGNYEDFTGAIPDGLANQGLRSILD